jgi:hypothetical protein
MERRQEFYGECSEAVVINQITFAELGRRDPHTIPFRKVLRLRNGRGGTVRAGCVGFLRSCCDDRVELRGCFCGLHYGIVCLWRLALSHCDPCCHVVARKSCRKISEDLRWHEPHPVVRYLFSARLLIPHLLVRYLFIAQITRKTLKRQPFSR